ncbi:pre-mRNA-splicing factor CWC2, putative [Plasmodium ovale]|uniref:Pre-mRNA-splicing factor CWC2, putative n=2 Tax=Plasmodium ovale TaxID=36330 RepID=A0A1D3U8T9_PLAOA|nr:pre-mRNA-splicing factor CWC2, putative (CWC2) [Plasmodium ovale curtisi]SBS92815.1 pre-mRNA-splicing factor CWC2, putative (CWC2) [Plasmodium ovale curtisi]SCQ16514.1 pre-mRNA-splicing factor CWC2, putative [Plasmodium ovale]
MSLKRFFNFSESEREKGKKKINAKKGENEERETEQPTEEVAEGTVERAIEENGETVDAGDATCCDVYAEREEGKRNRSRNRSRSSEKVDTEGDTKGNIKSDVCSETLQTDAHSNDESSKRGKRDHAEMEEAKGGTVAHDGKTQEETYQPKKEEGGKEEKGGEGRSVEECISFSETKEGDDEKGTQVNEEKKEAAKGEAPPNDECSGNSGELTKKEKECSGSGSSKVNANVSANVPDRDNEKRLGSSGSAPTHDCHQGKEDYTYYSGAQADGYLNYPYYYNQYYSGMVPTGPVNTDLKRDGNNSASPTNVDANKVKKEKGKKKKTAENEFRTNEYMVSSAFPGMPNAYPPHDMNSYYNAYGYGGIPGNMNNMGYINDMGNVSAMSAMTNIPSVGPVGHITNMGLVGHVNYNYYYGMYDYGKEMEGGVKPYGFCSLLDKSLELMKKSDKVKEILKSPARLQVTQEELNKSEYTEGSEQYNIWFGKYVTDKYDKNSRGGNTPRFVAKYKCNPLTDSGYTKADRSYTSKQYFCIYFARGCCAYGHNCLYRHRIPNENDEIEFEASMDIFGREKFSTFKEDMTGVGNFNSDCRTLFIGSLHINNFNEVPLIEQTLYDEFSNFGNIDYVRFIPNKNIAFVQFTNRVNAEFAKVAMSDQPIENHSTALTIKWAFELKAPPHHFSQYYNNPYMYNQAHGISPTWDQYMVHQQYSSTPGFHDYAAAGGMGGISGVSGMSGCPNVGMEGSSALSAHYKKMNDRCNNLNNSLSKIDHMFDMQN